MHVINVACVILQISVTRLESIAMRAVRARSPAFVTPATYDFRNQTCYANHKQSTTKKRSVCVRKRCCATCGRLVTDARHECNKLFCANRKQNRDVGHLCYMKPLKDVLPDAS